MYRGREPVVHQQLITAVAAVLTTEIKAVAYVFQNDPDSNADIYVGTADAAYVRIQPGQSLALGLEDTSRIYFKTAAQESATLNVLAIR